MQKVQVGLRGENVTFSILSALKLNFSTTAFATTLLCTILFTADTDNNSKIVHFTYSCFYDRGIKVGSVEKTTRINYFYYF